MQSGMKTMRASASLARRIISFLGSVFREVLGTTSAKVDRYCTTSGCTQCVTTTREDLSKAPHYLNRFLKAEPSESIRVTVGE